jgi:putative chitinase
LRSPATPLPITNVSYQLGTYRNFHPVSLIPCPTYQSGQPYTWPDKIYYGRGDVQLTWYENYERMGDLMGLPLLEQPELALDPEISAQILVEGMILGKSNRGDFTGYSLENFFNPQRDDPFGARRIINGLDSAHTIAGYHYKFLEAIRKAS